MADAESGGSRTGLRDSGQTGQRRLLAPDSSGNGGTGAADGFWADADWLFCRDGKWRPVEPGTFPLANGSAARVGRLRGYGNAVNAEAAKVFIESVMGVTGNDA
jgi:DNA (cytosine-5)-methyltransferase 1